MFSVIHSSHCQQPCSAQLAELEALTVACQEGAGKTVNIYTDSAYAHGVCHLFGAVWKMRGFKKSDGTPILHCTQIVKLMTALLLPERVAIIKCQAHRKGNDYVIRGNNAADEAASVASHSGIAIQAMLILPEPAPTEEDVIRMQEKAGVYEHGAWAKRGALRTPTGLWRTVDGLLVAPTALVRMLITNAHGFDHCSRGEVVRKIKKQGFWSPFLQSMVDNQLNECDICATNNIKKTITTPLGHIPTPEGPFRHLVLDYVDMIKKVNGKRYMLVIIDRFSRWVEATPSKDQSAATVIKFLTREVMPRFGIPTEISSDNGSAFIQKTLKQVVQHLRIKQRLGCVYHPQSQGIVERVNGTLKAKISKICASTRLNWVDALPLALMSYRMQTNRMTHLTPHEMLTGRPMPAPTVRGPHKGPPLEQLELEIKMYIKQLTAIHKLISKQERDRDPAAEDEEPRGVEPGDLIYLKVFRRRWNEARREGPYKVTRATSTAIQVEGSTTWYHLNHCTRAAQARTCDQTEENSDTKVTPIVHDNGHVQVPQDVQSQPTLDQQPDGNSDEPAGADETGEIVGCDSVIL